MLLLRSATQALAPLVFASRFWFCAPFIKDKTGTFRVNLVLAVLSFAVQMTAIGLSIYSAWVKASQLSDLRNDAFLLLSISHYFFNQIHRLLLLVNNVYNYHRIVECLNSILNLSREIPFHRKFLLKLFIVCCVEVTFMVPISLVLGGYKIKRGGSVFETFLVTVGSASIGLQEVHPVTFLLVIQGLMDALQKRIYQLDCEMPPPTAKIITVTGFRDKPTVIEMNNWYTMTNELVTIRQLNRRTWDLKTKINNIYSFQLFTIIAHTFIQLIYYFFLNALINKDIPSSKQFLTGLTIVYVKLWTILMVLKIVWMVSLCHYIAETFKRTGAILHAQWTKTVDTSARQELLGISAELSHLEPQISACGVFDINHSLILSMVAALVMYFLILIQADFTTQSQGLNSLERLTYFT